MKIELTPEEAADLIVVLQGRQLTLDDVTSHFAGLIREGQKVMRMGLDQIANDDTRRATL